MELKKIHWISIAVSLLIVIGSLFFIDTSFFFILIGFGLLIGAIPFVVTSINETRIANEKEEMFLEFARNLVESVSSGTPISKSIINLKKKSYGVLSKNVRKLANQISLGIPLNSALQTFSKDVDNKTISRALTLIGQAEKAGGDIGRILQAVAGAVTMTDKLKKERKAAISTLVVQGYIIFFVFILIILIMQFKILPMVTGLAGAGLEAGFSGTSTIVPIESSELADAFLYLLLIQGFFSGLAIGKLSEGNIKAGIKHSFALMVISFLIFSVANLFLGA
ncbi:MAG: type II secretion system F family protein [Candidatus Pacearchaeota archaeon]|jgi:flagellar protein FlaJ